MAGVVPKNAAHSFMGFGCVDSTDAVACAADRATFFATGRLGPDQNATILLPVPITIGGKARPHKPVSHAGLVHARGARSEEL